MGRLGATSVMTFATGHEASAAAIGVEGDRLLLLGGVEDRRAVGGTNVVALAVLGRGVADLEKELQQLAEADLVGVEDDLLAMRLGMGAVVAVGGSGHIAGPNEAGCWVEIGTGDAGSVAMLPEAPAGQNCTLSS